MDMAKQPEEQYELIRQTEKGKYYRINPIPFTSDIQVASGEKAEVAPQEIHKYTVVLWVEGEDPQCTNDLIGGHAGLSMQFTLIDEKKDESSDWWDGLIFWED